MLPNGKQAQIQHARVITKCRSNLPAAIQFVQ